MVKIKERKSCLKHFGDDEEKRISEGEEDFGEGLSDFVDNTRLMDQISF